MATGDSRDPRVTTRLRATRLDRGFSQQDLAELTGIPLRSLERLDRGEVDDLPFRWLVNLSIALWCKPVDLAESEWFKWKEDITPARRTPRPSDPPAQGSRIGYQRARRRNPRTGKRD